MYLNSALSLKIKHIVNYITMEQLLDESLEIRSDPNPIQKKSKRKIVSTARKNEDHIDELVMIALQRFFSIKTNQDILWNQFGNKDSKDSISLRVIDWFVTNYSKKNAVHYPLSEDGKEVCIVWQEYKQKLRGYSKYRFDPFCRHSRIRFHLGGDRAIVTTVGQLNFFRWAIENKILDYIHKHREVIEKDMNESYHVHYDNRRRPDMKKRRKRREISKVANNGICMYRSSLNKQ